jgi:tetratricopeptide (TPR) repeat protein
MNMRLYISVIGLLSLLAATAFGQRAGNRSIGANSYEGDRDCGVVRGQVSSDSPIVGLLTVELLSTGHAATISASLEPGGGFELHGVPPGAYQLRLTGAAGTTIYEGPVFINGGYQNLSIQVPEKPMTVQSRDATVSIRQLQHKVPADARKEFDKGRAASIKGDRASALDHFQKAVVLDPGFADAFNNIGMTYAAFDQLQPAADQFQKAIDLVPDHPGAVANLSIVLCKLQHYREAGEMARRALKVNPGLLKLRYVLGISLINEGGNNVEALDNLKRATVEVPGAHLLVAKILAEDGRREDAAQHLEDYLRSSPAGDQDRPAVEVWLRQLRR